MGPVSPVRRLPGYVSPPPLLAHVRPLRADAQEPGEEEGGLSDLLAAARVIFSRPNTRALIAFPAGAAAIEGAIDLLVVVLAVQILAIGPGAAGYLSAAFGAGGLLGATIAVLFAGRRLALPLAAATLIGGLALGALALASTVLVAVLLLVVVGAARTMQSVTAQTLLQRSTPLDVIVCAFALIESMRDLGMIFSALIIPLLIGLGGAKAAFLGMACFALIAVLAAARRIRRIDSEASIPVVEMGMLRNMGIFSALPAAPLETLAREAHYVSVQPGTAIISEGEEGDSYYAITHGSVRVTKGEERDQAAGQRRRLRGDRAAPPRQAHRHASPRRARRPCCASAARPSSRRCARTSPRLRPPREPPRSCSRRPAEAGWPGLT